MKAVVSGNIDGVHQPILIKREKPVISPIEVLLKIHATAINRADLLQVMGLYPPPKGVTDILGLEAAGEVIEVGSEVSSVGIGDRCCVLLSGGGCAEYVAADLRMLLAIPDEMSFQTAAAIPEVWYTAFLNLCIAGHLQKGEKTLIHAGAVFLPPT